ncbi:MAG: ABC transporter permease [Bacteroidota bacterium]
MTPTQLAWRKYRSNYPAMFGLIYVSICLLAAIFGYWVAPDASRHGNLQVVELAKQPPGTEVDLLMVPIPSVSEIGFWEKLINGSPARFVPIPLKTAELRPDGDLIRFQAWSGAEDQIRLSRFAGKDLPAIRAENLRQMRYHLGTDQYGRDVWSRILLGSRVSLSIGFMSVLISLLIGISLGTVAGYFGGWLDKLIMWLVSVMWAIPTLLLALAIVFVLQRGFWQLFLAIGLSMWVEVARIVRGQILSVREQQFAEAARALGYTHSRVMFRHVLPNVLSPIIVIAVANFGAAVLIESGLSFLGIGVEVPIPTWGRMIYEGYTYIVFENGKWLAFFPGLALILLVMSINLIGIGLRDALDVKMKRK